MQALKNKKLLAEKSLQEAEFKKDSLTDTIKETQDARYRIHSQIQVYENRKSYLEEMQKEYDGYQYAVKKLLKERERNAEINSKMVGVLASLIKVPEKYETAVEVALGNAVQNIVTTDEQNAKELINYLKRNDYGRATFLPMNKMQRKSIAPEDAKALTYPGCFGLASDLVEYDSKLENVISNLLGATIVVDTIDTAIAISNKTKLSYKIVAM